MPHLLFFQIKLQGRKYFFWRPPSPLSKGLDDCPTPPPPQPPTPLIVRSESEIANLRDQKRWYTPNGHIHQFLGNAKSPVNFVQFSKQILSLLCCDKPPPVSEETVVGTWSRLMWSSNARSVLWSYNNGNKIRLCTSFHSCKGMLKVTFSSLSSPRLTIYVQ